jgi:hypothetical protein
MGAPSHNMARSAVGRVRLDATHLALPLSRRPARSFYTGAAGTP